MRSDWAEKISGTLITTETPFSPTDPSEFEYSFPDEANAELLFALSPASGVV